MFRNCREQDWRSTEHVPNLALNWMRNTDYSSVVRTVHEHKKQDSKETRKWRSLDLFVSTSVLIVKLGSWSWSMVLVKVKIHAQKRIRAPYVSTHLPPSSSKLWKSKDKKKDQKQCYAISKTANNHNPHPLPPFSPP